jgi:hypothetical protein
MTRLMFALGLALTTVLAGFDLAEAQTPTPTAPAESGVQGELPIHGGFALVVWSGGALDDLRASARQKGCDVRSVWVIRQGEIVGHIFGAPTVANESSGSATAFPGSQAAGGSPLIVVCAVVTAPAPIESIEVRNIATGWSARVVSGLPSGCVEFHGYQVSRSGDMVMIEVMNRVPAEGALLACTAIYGYVTSDIPLPGSFVSGVSYMVHVNEKVVTFTP